ncbi:MAG: phosphoglycerate kinase [Candidatus Cloacimonetes bacterium]|nr:phosphoglycerate kinase [Candidatus Cloacimonadota bacterium]
MAEKISIPDLEHANLRDKIVLVRVDHNIGVVDGIVVDAFRIDATLPILFHIVSKGGKLILMTHVGRPKNKKTNEISISSETSVKPIVDYLNHKLRIKFEIPEFTYDDKFGINGIDTSINLLIKRLQRGEIGGIYLPNTRWFKGEEDNGELADCLSKQLAGLADVYVNDAFGSWQPHVSTIGPTKYLPSYAGYLMQKEIENLEKIFSPVRPMLAVVAGSKFDTKIGPLSKLLEKIDYLILGGVIYNAYLAVKYGIKIKGISDDDLLAAKDFVKLTNKYPGKLIELPYIVESDFLDSKKTGTYRVLDINKIEKGTQLNYILDISEKSYKLDHVKKALMESKTIFVNAVMGFTNLFTKGTKDLYALIDKNTEANKLYGGGDTLLSMKTLLPGEYLQALNNPKYYFFTGGGTILKAINEGTVLGLEPIKALVDNHKRLKKNDRRQKITISIPDSDEVLLTSEN